MAVGKRISELPLASELQPSDLLVISRGRRNYRVPASSLSQPLSGSAASAGFSFPYRQDGQTGPGLPDSASGMFRWSGSSPQDSFAVWMHRTAANGLDAAQFWLSVGGSYLQVSSSDGQSVLYELQAVSMAGNVIRLDLGWISGAVSPDPGSVFFFSPMAKPGQAGLICGRPSSNAEPQNGQVLAYNASSGFWEPFTPAGLQLMRLVIDWTSTAFRTSTNSLDLPLGILPEGGKVLGVTARFQPGFTGVPGVEVSLGWQGGMESYMSFVPASAGMHDVLSFLSATPEEHELRVFFRAAQPFGNGTVTFLTSGSLDLKVIWISM